jgi:DUF1680 family protein
MIPSVEAALNDPGNAAQLRNFRVAAGLEEGEHTGANWSDGDCYKWIEAMAHVYAVTKSPSLDRKMDEWISIIGKAQAPDGYLSTNIQLSDKGRYTKIIHHEMYNMGHLMTAACIHHRATGKDTFLKIARRVGDHLSETFNPTPPELKRFGFNPSQIMGLVELYRATGEPRYLELAGVFVDNRGSRPASPDEPGNQQGGGGTAFARPTCGAALPTYTPKPGRRHYGAPCSGSGETSPSGVCTSPER